MPIYTAAEILVVTLFSYFKIDEDCFDCFKLCDELEIYSIFQLRKNLVIFKSEIDESQDDVSFEIESGSQEEDDDDFPELN